MPVARGIAHLGGCNGVWRASGHRRHLRSGGEAKVVGYASCGPPCATSAPVIRILNCWIRRRARVILHVMLDEPGSLCALSLLPQLPRLSLSLARGATRSEPARLLANSRGFHLTSQPIPPAVQSRRGSAAGCPALSRASSSSHACLVLSVVVRQKRSWLSFRFFLSAGMGCGPTSRP